ncbi:hypothetical protein KO566_02660 [Flavobacteriaceae bacterium XHP0103]|uniref:hypothetical protein n=1 Tax=Marixanthotalea marina TaxID=2844359 RepID=UPI002989CECB|nr:hypothetical protein [Marixanthotalea marina]MBU3820949.1 hypothetical protein [Marixanthotalea marina]
MRKDIKALFKEYSESAKKESENPATAKEVAEYRRIVKKLKKYKKEKRVASLEDWQNIMCIASKMGEEQKACVEDIPLMPPGALPLTDTPIKHVTPELFEAKKSFDEKSIVYYELVGAYFEAKKVDPKKLWSLYDECLSLYDNYIKRYNALSKPSKK